MSSDTSWVTLLFCLGLQIGVETTLKLILMTGPECSLCLEAEDCIHRALEGRDYRLEHRDITQSFDLKKRYGLRIPVLVLQSGTDFVELFWPFDVTNVQDLCSKQRLIDH